MLAAAGQGFAGSSTSTRTSPCSTRWPAIVERLDEASIVLTPHQCEPNGTEMVVGDNELTSLRYGIFNWASSPCATTGRAAPSQRWWAEQLYRACYDAVETGIFTDQKYCDLVPGLFGRFHAA